MLGCGHTDTVGYELRVMESELPEYLSLKYDGQYSAAAEEDRARA